MLRFLAAMIAAIFISCASGPPLEFRAYRACSEEHVGGRLLHDPGTVVGEQPEGKLRIYSFQADRHPRDGNHIQQITKINRFCEVAKHGIMSDLLTADRPQR
jgi:hypothetical protein